MITRRALEPQFARKTGKTQLPDLYRRSDLYPPLNLVQINPLLAREGL
jgi:hypothetical protein